MDGMFRLYLLLFIGGSIIGLCGAAENSHSKDTSSSSQSTENVKTPTQSDLHKITTSSANSRRAKQLNTAENPPTDEVRRHDDWPFFPYFDPNLFYNPYFNQVSDAVFKNLVNQYQNDLEMIRNRQNLVLQYAECSGLDGNKCEKVSQPDAVEDLKAINYWNWGYNKPDVQYVTYDRFYAVMNSFKSSIEKLTLRQNTIYEYVQCSCTAKTQCSTSIKPVLDVMFSNNRNTTGQLIQSLFVPENNYNPASSFFQTLASYFSQIPSWFAFNFSPLSSAFGSASNWNTGYPSYPASSSASSSPVSTLPTSTSAATVPVSSSASTATYPQTTTVTPAYWASQSSGSQPVYSSSSSYTSTSGTGQQVSGGYVSTGGGGHPSQEQYFVSSNGDNVHISSSTDGSGVTISSSKPSTGRSRRYAYGVNPGVAAAGVGISAAQAGIQAGQAGINAGIHAAQAGINAGIQATQVGINAGIQATQAGISAVQHSVNAGLAGASYGNRVPY